MASVKRGARKTRSTSRRQADDEPQALLEDEVTVEIEDLATFDESINILLYGPSGSGKTVLAGGAPNATFLSTEKGVVAAKRVGHKTGLIRTPDWEHVVAGLKLAEQRLGPDDWLIVDSITKMQILYVRWILKVNNIRNSSRDLDIPAIKDHQKWQNGFMRFIDKICDAPYNSIMVATSMIKTDEDGEDIVLPNITGKDYAISSYVCAAADVALYYDVSKVASTDDNTVRRALAQKYPPFFAKDRYNCLGKWIDVAEGEFWAMNDIIGMIYEALDSDADAA